MPENKPMEILMQEKMEGFRLEPSPSDWQAIYDRLHPGKKRRMIWWLLPLVATLFGGALWYSNTQSYVSDKEINSAVANPEKVADKKTALKPVHISEVPLTSYVRPESNEGNKSATSLITSKSKADNKPSTTRTQFNSPKQNKTVGKSTKETTVEQAVIVEQTTVFAEPQSTVVDKQETKSEQGITTSGIDSNQAGSEKKLSIVDTTNNSTTTKTQIPTKTKPRKWNLSVYVAAGPAFPTEPLSVFPQMMAADLSSSPIPGNNNQIYTNTSEQNGWHFAGGITAEKKMGKRWLFSVGLGISSSTWKTTIEKYQDSVLSGAFYSRVKLSTETYDYHLLMAELPLQFSNKISGKKAGSLWWSIGLNNQFKINLTQKATFNNPLTSAFSDKKSLNSSTRFYQPQLRFGLLYDHAKNLHWQVQPLLQYSLVPVYKDGNSDDMQLTNFQLQFNLFFQGSKHSAKTKK